jgi:hypothetical protein
VYFGNKFFPILMIKIIITTVILKLKPEWWDSPLVQEEKYYKQKNV